MKKLLVLYTITMGLFSCDTSEQVTQDEPTVLTSDTLANTVHADFPDSSLIVLPRNESAQDTGLYNTIEILRHVIRNRDTLALFEMMDDSLVSSYGGLQYGKKAFVEKWGLNKNNASSELWPMLSKLVQLGGVFRSKEKNEFILPYMNVVREPETQYVVQQIAVCTHNKVKVYTDEGFTESGTLSYEMVAIPSGRAEPSGYAWMVTLDNRMNGYVHSDSFYFMSDYALELRKTNGKWKIFALAPFD